MGTSLTKSQRGETKINIKRIGIDSGKNVFHVHGAGRGDRAVYQRRVTRRQLERVMGEIEPCLVDT